MSKQIFYKMLSLWMSLNNYRGNLFYEDYILDEQVNDCMLSLYFSMLSNEQKQIDCFYEQFLKKYKKLNQDQQEIAKVEIAKILDIEYKPKTIKKEKRRDE